MAKGKKKSKKRKPRPGPASGGAATSLEEAEAPRHPAVEAVSETEPDDDNDADRGQPDDAGTPRRGRIGPARAGGTAQAGGLTIYKPGQGYYTRVGTAIFAAVLIGGLWNFLYGELGVYVDPDKAWTFYLQLGVPTTAAVALGLLVYWLVGRSRRTCDFMILTEGEMKKVSWSSRREVIGSTKVVIFMVIAMAVLLFCVDIIFAWLFHLIGVLQVAPSVFGKAAGPG